MAETYDAFKKEFEAIQKDADKAADAIDKSTRVVGQTSGIIAEGIKELGLRIQELKDAGAKGTALKDFEGDAEVKKMSASLDAYLKQVENELTAITSLHGGLMTNVKNRFQKLAKDLKAEIASRKKQLSTKIGTGNKSLPDMEKLLAEMTKYQDAKPYTIVEAYAPEPFSDHQKQFDRDVARQLSQTKEVALSKLQAQMQEQALNVRIMAGNVNKVRSLHDEIMTECKNAEKAAASRDAKGLLAAKVSAARPMKQMKDLVDPYTDAMNDSFLKNQIAYSKDKGKIEDNYKAMLTMMQEASAAFKKAAAETV